MRLLAIILLLVSVSSFAVPLLGVVLEDGTDRPIPYCEILYASGKPLGQADRRGRFELEVERRSASLLVVRPGYDTAKVELQDYVDLLDVVITLRSSVQELGQTTVRAKVTPKWRDDREVSVARLEDAAGLRFDVAEHLSQLPGMSGQRDFSSALSYDGSRPEEVAYHLGGVRVPNMRHLDVGFPGNLSVINPHILRGVEVRDHYGEGPAQQGLASSIQFAQAPGSEDEFKLRGSMGTTMREVTITGPWIFWDAFTISFRWLDPSMLKNMGEKFFTEFKKRDAACGGSAAECQAPESKNPFSLSAWDLYSHFSGKDSSGAKWALTTLMSRDEYQVNQDTSLVVDSVNSATLIGGDQAYNAIIGEYAGADGLAWHTGWIQESVADTLRDTTGFRSDSNVQGDDSFRNFIDAGRRSQTHYVIGADDLLSKKLLGADVSWAAEYERTQSDRTWMDYNRSREGALSGNFLEALGRLAWKGAKNKVIVGAGLSSLITGGQMPIASVDWDRKLDSAFGLHVFSGGAWRSQYTVRNDGREVVGFLNSGASGKLGMGVDTRTIKASIHGFGRYYPDPEFPEPKGFWHYKEQAQADMAWVSGLSGTAEYRTSHHFSLQSNLSSVYGEYAMQGGSSITWPANVRLEMSTHLRLYPRTDSLISVIVSHRAAWHRPLYSYTIQLADAVQQGTRTIHESGMYTDLFRTDVRVNLDLKSAWKPLESVRFFLEADNVFEPLGMTALTWLGSDNARERSQVVLDADGNSDNGIELVPFMAKGMGLYVQFGVEGNLGI